MPLKSDSKINIKASGDLSVEGSDQAIMTAAVRHSDSLKISENQDVIEIKATSDLRIQLPAFHAVTVEKVGGDGRFSGLSQRVIIGKVSGDLEISNLAGASVEIVGGDISIRETNGAVEVARVGGDLIGKNVESVLSHAVGGDIYLSQVTGTVNLVAGGDVDVSLANPEISAVSIEAGGDAQLVVAQDSKAQLQLHSRGHNIQVDACGQLGDWEEQDLTIVLGDGGNLVVVTAGGEISIQDHNGTSDEFEQRFESSFEDWKEFGVNLEKQIEESVAAATDHIHWATLGAAGAGEKVKRKVDKAMRKLDGKWVNIDSHGIVVEKPGKQVVIDRKGVHVNESGKVVGFTYPGEVNAKSKSSGAASDEERILVLKMLQDKKITVEEAEKLLSALEK